MANHALTTFGAIALAIFFFSAPLVLKYHVLKPVSKEAVPGDVVPVDQTLSSIWCQGIDIKSESKFQSFVYETEPEVVENEFERTWSDHRIILPNKDQEYFGFYLLRGSRVNVSTCARLLRAGVTVVKGYDGLKQCLQEHRRFELYGDDSSEENSQSESDEDTSSISSSQGVITNETDAPYVCTNSVNHGELPHSYRCVFPFHRTVARKPTVYQEVEETDYYFYVFSSSTYLDLIPNEFSIQFTIDRTHYNYLESSRNCSADNHCALPIPFGSELKIIVQMEAENGTLRTEKVQMACKPREWLFMFFYGMFLVVIFLCAFQ